jgi:lipopolysaccharide transport system ATP-binding protein
MVSIKVENLSKIYRLGEIGTGTITQDIDRWFKTKVMGKEDPFLKIGESNDRAKKGIGDIVYSLQDINFEINQGDAVGIIGRNGAGKSTLLKILSRVTTPTTGRINIKGRVASLLEVGTGFHPELTGRENIYLNGAILGMRKREIDRKLDEIIDFSGVERYVDTPVKRYSSGMYVRLAFAVAAHLESEILIVDEVLAVGDAEFQKKALNKMQLITRGEGRTILFVSHNMATIQNLCNNGILLRNGYVEMSSDIQTVVSSYIRNSNRNFEGLPLLARIDRQGTGKVKFAQFHVEDELGHVIDIIIPGDSITFVFGLAKFDQSAIAIDLGMAISTESDQIISILYSSYQNIFFKMVENLLEIRLTFPNFPLSKGFYKIVGRILENGEELDSMQNGIGEFQVIDGDFYKTGNFGGMGLGPILLTGQWKE